MTLYKPIPCDPIEYFSSPFRDGELIPRRHFKCRDCDNKPDAPMLKDEVWSTIAGPRELLCIPCTVRAMGRDIQVYDLRHCVGNSAILYFLDNQKSTIEYSVRRVTVPI